MYINIYAYSLHVRTMYMYNVLLLLCHIMKVTLKSLLITFIRTSAFICELFVLICREESGNNAMIIYFYLRQ